MSGVLLGPPPTAAAQPLTTTGTFAAMPATGTGSKAFYFATDKDGGTLYQDRTNGGVYTQCAPGVTAASGYEIPGTYVENVSGTPQTIAAGGNADVTNLAISIPATARPVWIEAYVRCQASTVVGTPAASGQSAALILYETTSGNTLVEAWAQPISNLNSTAFVLRGKKRIASSTTSTRTFKINVVGAGSATNGIGLIVTNAATASSWMRAFAA